MPHPGDIAPPFPDPLEADPGGLLAQGGWLTPTWLLAAYRRGIFPWYGEDTPILWWSPDPRMVFVLEDFRVARSVGKSVRRAGFRFTFDNDFGAVIRGCAAPAPGREETWIVPGMIDAYEELHRAGHAHSVECWRGGVLAGGVYGVAVGGVFCAESMFHRETDASKAALAVLCTSLRAWGAELLDAQMPTRHLASLGGVAMGRAEYIRRLGELRDRVLAKGAWRDAVLPRGWEAPPVSTGTSPRPKPCPPPGSP